MSGTDASIPLAAGRIGQGGGNSLMADPSALINTMSRLQQMQLFPGQLQRQQQELQQGGLSIEKAQQELRAYKNNLVANGMLPLFQKGDGATLQDAMSTLGQLQAGGYDTSGMVGMLHKSGATGGQPLLTALKSAVTQAHPELGVPKIEFQTQGDATIPYNTNIFAGPLGPMGPPIPMNATTAQKNELVRVWDPKSQGYVNIPRVAAAPMVGVGGGGAAPPPASAPAVSPPPAMAPSSAPAAPPAGALAGPGPAQEAAMLKTGGESADTFHRISVAGDNARGQDALLSTMQAEAQNFRTGPGADLVQSVKRTIVGIGAQFGTAFGIDPAKLASQESVDKIANQLADAQGAGSDARLHVNQGANPSSHNTPEGLDLIIRQLRGNTDYLKVRQQLAAAYPDKADSQGFLAKVAGNLDPRVFQYNRLSQGQKWDYFKGISDKATFKSAYKWAEDNKVLGGIAQ